MLNKMSKLRSHNGNTVIIVAVLLGLQQRLRNYSKLVIVPSSNSLKITCGVATYTFSSRGIFIHYPLVS
jgi:hypothetical protein